MSTMDIKKLAADLSVAAQLEPSDIAEIAARGFKSVISNRPDDEAEAQPSFAEVAREAHRFGLEARYIPVVSGKLSDADVAAFSSAIQVLPKPILAYCRTGTRCTMLWALSEARRRPLSDILTVANAAGYDLKSIEQRLLAASGNASAH